MQCKSIHHARIDHVLPFGQQARCLVKRFKDLGDVTRAVNVSLIFSRRW